MDSQGTNVWLKKTRIQLPCALYILYYSKNPFSADFSPRNLRQYVSETALNKFLLYQIKNLQTFCKKLH